MIPKGTIIRNATKLEKQIIIVYKIDVLSKIEIKMIKKEIINSGAVVPVVILTNVSRKVLIQIKIKRQIKGNNSIKLIGTRIYFVNSHDKIEVVKIEKTDFK